jgi:copper chaperone CopZ
MTKKEFKVIGMDCPSCAMLIEGELEDAGVQTAKCSYAEEKLEVEYDENKVDEVKIEEVVKQTGYRLHTNN